MPASASEFAHGLLVVDDEAHVTVVIGRLTTAFLQREELVAEVDEGRRFGPAPKIEIEQTAVEGQRLVDVSDLESDVIEADHPGFPCRHESLLRADLRTCGNCEPSWTARQILKGEPSKPFTY